jgi:hypothetical protein
MYNISVFEAKQKEIIQKQVEEKKWKKLEEKRKSMTILIIREFA